MIIHDEESLGEFKDYVEDRHHCVLVIKENFNHTVSVLDPLKKEPFRAPIIEFFHYYDVTGIESVCSREHGGTMFFDETHLSHLL